MTADRTAPPGPQSLDEKGIEGINAETSEGNDVVINGERTGDDTTDLAESDPAAAINLAVGGY